MSYAYSFNTPPPIGFTINSATGLITIAPTATPFTGSLSVRVFDGVSSDIKSIPIVLQAPIVTPLITELIQSTCSSGGEVVSLNLEINPVACSSGIDVSFAVLEISKNISFCSIGEFVIEETIEDAEQVGNVEISIAFSEYQLGAGLSGTATAEVSIDYDTNGIDQAVVWSIVPGPFSTYAAIDQLGVLTSTNGSFYSGDVTIFIKATSVAYPATSQTKEVYLISRFTSIDVFPTSSIVGASELFSIDSILNGQGEMPSSIVQYINITIAENGNYTYLSGDTVDYTSGTDAATITISASYYYPTSGDIVYGSATVPNTG